MSLRTLLCPYCHWNEVTFVEKVGYKFRRYRCKLCHKTFLYDTTPVHDPRQVHFSEALRDPYGKLRNP